MSGAERVLQEFKEIYGDPISSKAKPVGLFNENDPMRWRVTFVGPRDTSYKGGLFYLSIQFPLEYPEKGPKVCFLTPIYHINVNPRVPTSPGGDELGQVNISTLKWSKPVYKMRELLTYIYALFYNGDPDNPYDLDRADEFINNRAIYEEKIKYFTKKYANPMLTRINLDRDQDWNFSYP